MLVSNEAPRYCNLQAVVLAATTLVQYAQKYIRMYVRRYACMSVCGVYVCMCVCLNVCMFVCVYVWHGMYGMICVAWYVWDGICLVCAAWYLWHGMCGMCGMVCSMVCVA